MCRFVLSDLLALCPRIAEHSAAGTLVYELNRKIIVGSSEWNVDLVLGPPAGIAEPPKPPVPIRQVSPATIRTAIEAKTIMTEHGKARAIANETWTPFINSPIDMIPKQLLLR